MAAVFTDTRRARWQVALLMLLAVLPFLPALGNFYFYDDGRLLREGARVEQDGWPVIFSGGFNGHARPLPIASAFAVRELFGVDSPAPFHLLAIALHAINVLLIYRLLARLIAKPGNNIAWLAAAVCAVQWAGTEAVSYIAGIGVLWSALGGLLAANGAVDWRGIRDVRATACILLGLVISLGGGEYGVAMAPGILICALWPSGDGPLNWRRALSVAALVSPVYIIYIGLIATFTSHGRLGSEYVVGTHVLKQIADNLGFLILPSKWVRPLPCLALTGVFLAVASFKNHAFRAQLFSPRSLLLVAAAIGALLPFSFSLMGNYSRFVYLAMPFLSAWLFLLIFTLVAASPKLSPLAARRISVGVAVFFIAANAWNAHLRMRSEARRGQQVARFLETIADVQAAHPQQRLKIYIDHDVESAVDTAVALGRVSRDQCYRRPPLAFAAPGEVLLLAQYSWQHPFRFQIFELPKSSRIAAKIPAGQ